jgi:hypothetical protein
MVVLYFSKTKFYAIDQGAIHILCLQAKTWKFKSSPA